MLKVLSKALAPAPHELSVVELLVKNLGQPRLQRSHEHVHASDVTRSDWCGRRFRLLDVYPKKVWESLSPGLAATFDVGKMTAKLFVEQWAGDAVVGNWLCRTCGKKKDFCKRPGDGCEKQATCAWEYEEVQFYHQEGGISGSIDCLLDLKGSRLTLIELKIMKADDFDKLPGPLGEHKERTNLYMRLVEQSSHPSRHAINCKQAKTVYISRGFGKKHADVGQIVPFKEFTVHRDDSQTDYLIQRGRDVLTSRQNNTMLERPNHCDNPNCSAAKKCPVRKECWS